MSEVSERSGAHRVRPVVVTPQPTLAYLLQHAVSWILIASVVVLPLAWGGAQPWILQAVHVLVWWGGVLWAARLAVLRRAELIVSPVSAPVLVLVSYVIIRYGLAEVEPVARAPMMLAITAAMLFFLTLNNSGHRSQVGWVVGLLALVAGGLVALAAWQALRPLGWGQPFQIRFDLARATFARPGDFAGFLTLVLPMLAAFFFFSRWSYPAKVFLLVATLVTATGLVLSRSLEGWLGVLASAVVLGQYLLRRRNVRLRWVLLGGGLWFALIVAAISYAPRRPTADTDAPLWLLWGSAWRIAREELLLGCGPGMFVWRASAARISQLLPDRTQNEYLQVLAEFGVVGLVLCGWLLVMYLVSGSRILGARAERYSVNTLSNRYAFVVGSLAAVTGLAAHGLVGNPLQVPAIVGLLAVVTATSLTCGVHPSGKLDDDLVLPGRRQTVMMKGVLKWGFIFGLLFLLGLQATRLRKSVPAAWFLARAEAAQASLNWADAEVNFHRAWEFDGRSDAVAQALGDYYAARATWDLAERSALASEALRWYDRAYTRNPYRLETLVKMGRLHDLLGRREQAAERYRRAVEADPACGAYHAQLALHHLRWGDREAAEQAFARARERDPANPLAAREWERITARDLETSSAPDTVRPENKTSAQTKTVAAPDHTPP